MIEPPSTASAAEAASGADAGPSTAAAPTHPSSFKGSARLGPDALPTADSLDLPESAGYRLKNTILGPPLVTEQLSSERLGRLGALGVLSPDCISSSAYGSEEMLTQLVPFFGIAAFALVISITAAILAVLFFVTLSYLEVIAAYTKAGGSYVVARDNFGPRVAQVAAVALLIDYTVTVAVQCSAGTDALTSIFSGLTPYTVPITVGVVVLLAYGNLRGLREGAKFFALPTYLFILSLSSVVVVGIIRVSLNQLHPLPHSVGMISLGHHQGLLGFAAVLTLLKSFANGGSSLTGLEAISNGVSAFKRPEARNARITLVIMSFVLGTLVMGVTLLAHWSHASPFAAGSPTVVAQEAGWVFGKGGLGTGLRDIVITATMLILFTGGNTSFNGFPYLASFVAEDSFLPRQLRRRGHRLAFSTGIVVLAVVGIALVIGTGANLDALVSLYAIGVFTGFTMAGAGMVKYHRTHREGKWRRGQLINGFASVLSASVVAIFAVAKFTSGAWLVVIVGPILFFILIRLNRQYRTEAAQLEKGAAQALEAPVLLRHVVMVMVDRLDLATARALQYARTLHPDQLRAVHIVVDAQRANLLEQGWARLGLSQFPLDLVECPDRRLGRVTLELAAEAVAGGETELTILLPRRGYSSVWSRILHDRTADRIAAVVSQLPHVNATTVPYQLADKRHRVKVAATGSDAVVSQNGERSGGQHHESVEAVARVDGTVPIGDVTWRQRARVTGRIKSVRVQPRAGMASLEATLVDDSGGLLLIFQGRRKVPGIQPGSRLTVEGMVGERDRCLAILNPIYELVAGPDTEEDHSG